MPRHLLLVGLPGAGKTTVGRLVAGLLKAPFSDFDEIIEALADKPVSRIFAEDGEPAFRALETALGAELLAGAPTVLAPGGGYLADPQNRQRALTAGYVVYLSTSPSAAAARLGPGSGRPLLDGRHLVLRLDELLGQRQQAYLQAHGRVTTDGLAPAEVANRVAQLARVGAGW